MPELYVRITSEKIVLRSSSGRESSEVLTLRFDMMKLRTWPCVGPRQESSSNAGVRLLRGRTSGPAACSLAQATRPTWLDEFLSRDPRGH